MHLKNALRSLWEFLASKHLWTIKLDPDSRAALLEAFPPIHVTVHGEHMTIAFKPPPEVAEELAPLEGLPVNLTVVGYAEDDKGQAVVVTSPIPRVDGGIEHITISCNGTGPKYSNELINRGYEEVAGPVLRGVVTQEG